MTTDKAPAAPMTHVTPALFKVSYDILFEQLSDPVNFPNLYPNWAARITKAANGEFHGAAPDGGLFTIIPHTSKAHGVIDFEIIDESGNAEWSRSRIFPLKASGCAYLHLAVRWDGMDDAAWQAHTRKTDADVANARLILERRFGGGG